MDSKRVSQTQQLKESPKPSLKESQIATEGVLDAVIELVPVTEAVSYESMQKFQKKSQEMHYKSKSRIP